MRLLRLIKGSFRTGKSAEQASSLRSAPGVAPDWGPDQMRALAAFLGTGQKSRRTLTPEQAKAMVRAREKKRRATKRALRRSNA